MMLKRAGGGVAVVVAAGLAVMALQAQEIIKKGDLHKAALPDDAYPPIGTILPYNGVKETLPGNWVLCDGSTAGVPDLRGRFLRMKLPDEPLLAKKGSNVLANHKHYLPVLTGSIANQGSDPGQHAYIAEDDHTPRWRRSHLRNDGGNPTEGQHRHDLRNYAANHGTTEEKDGTVIDAGGVTFTPEYVAVQYIMRVR